MTKFSKIRGAVVNNLKNPKNNQNKKISKALAFSLIELSIVLIIIGLLVAGVTGGASLIESAKVRGFLNEVRGYQQAVNSFYVINYRLPGDLNEDGKIGWASNETYTALSFPFPYDGTDTANNHYIPTFLSAPFVDMYLNKIIDFEPTGQDNTSNFGTTARSGGLPISKNITDMLFHFEKGYDEQNNKNYSKYGIDDKVLLVARFYNNSVNPKYAKFFKAADEKLDDGLYNEGIVRGTCEGSNRNAYNSYANAIETGNPCKVMFIEIWK